MKGKRLIYRLIFLGITILVIPAVPLLIIFMGTNSPEYVIKGTLNMNPGMEVSAWELYLQAVKNLISLNLGNSTSSGQPVIREIFSGFCESFKIIIPALLFSYVVGTFIGIKNRQRKHQKNNRFDFVFYIPMIVFSYLFLFLSDKAGIDFTSGIKFVYAIIILSIYPVFVVSKSFVSKYHELIKSDFYIFDVSTGLPEKQIFISHLMKYFVLEYLSFFENIIIYMFGFIYFVEAPFDINGVGYRFVMGIQRFDYPLIIGFSIISIILFSAINIIVDFVKFRIDPRRI